MWPSAMMQAAIINIKYRMEYTTQNVCEINIFFMIISVFLTQSDDICHEQDVLCPRKR